MGILNEEVIIKVNGKTIKWYLDKGYEFNKYQDKLGNWRYYRNQSIVVKIKDLSIHCPVKIDIKCDICSKLESKEFRNLDRTQSTSGYYATGIVRCYSCARKEATNKQIGKNKKTNPNKNSYNYKKGAQGYASYKCVAKKKKLPFTLTLNDFKEITSKDCHYCGGFYSFTSNTDMKNGIDKKVPSLGYTIENSLPCCYTCNRMKQDYPYESFLLKIKQIYKYLSLSEEKIEN